MPLADTRSPWGGPTNTNPMEAGRAPPWLVGVYLGGTPPALPPKSLALLESARIALFCAHVGGPTANRVACHGLGQGRAWHAALLAMGGTTSTVSLAQAQRRLARPLEHSTKCDKCGCGDCSRLCRCHEQRRNASRLRAAHQQVTASPSRPSAATRGPSEAHGRAQ